MSLRAASSRAQRAVSSSRVTVTFFIYTILVFHESLVEWSHDYVVVREQILLVQERWKRLCRGTVIHVVAVERRVERGRIDEQGHPAKASPR